MPNANSNGDHFHPPEPLDADAVYTVNGCNGSRDRASHRADCPGDCEPEEVTGLDIEIHNELNAWRAAGMSMQGIGALGNVELEWRINALVQFIVAQGMATNEELDAYYKRIKLERLREIRNANEDQVKAARMAAMLGANKPLLGPNGRPIG